MSKIKAKNTKPELLVRRFLFSKGLRYRLHDKELPGKPDLIFKKHKVVVLINGCYWHGHEGCKYFVPPKTNAEWWLTKIKGNKERDTRNISELESKGWRVIVLWECELKPKIREQTLATLLQEFK